MGAGGRRQPPDPASTAAAYRMVITKYGTAAQSNSTWRAGKLDENEAAGHQNRIGSRAKILQQKLGVNLV
ncbi:hypothetical protein GCM10017687_88060 [Streptomyces echinatus]